MSNIRHFEIELADIKRSLAGMGDLVEQSLNGAVDAILHPRVSAREQARPLEEQLDTLDSEIEERAHRIMALQHPMVGDLRLLISVLHICSDLEQAGDLAESVCKRATFIAKHRLVENPPQLEELGSQVRVMVHSALESFVSADLVLARSVLTLERRADALTKECYEAIQVKMAADPGLIREYTHLLRAVGSLENVGDLAVSIAEESVYVHRGRVIRHHHKELDEGL